MPIPPPVPPSKSWAARNVPTISGLSAAGFVLVVGTIALVAYLVYRVSDAGQILVLGPPAEFFVTQQRAFPALCMAFKCRPFDAEPDSWLFASTQQQSAGTHCSFTCFLDLLH